ncbi:27338_t:CDS:2, partial [Racocetra persica]
MKKIKSKKNLGGHPEGPVWNYFTKGERVGKGKYKATCNFCRILWKCSEPIELESHLANYCLMADSTVIRFFLAKILSNDSEKINLRKKEKAISMENLINIAFTVCGIPWNVIENPFFIEALKKTNLSYKPPTCKFLAGNLLEQQLALINQKTDNIFKQYSNLTLAELRLLIEQMNISGGVLKNYSKTRWTTASETIESILNLEKVLKK